MIPARVEWELARGTWSKIRGALRDWRDCRRTIREAARARAACAICGQTTRAAGEGALATEENAP